MAGLYHNNDTGSETRSSAIVLFLLLLVLTLGAAFMIYAKSRNPKMDAFNIREAVSTFFGREKLNEIEEGTRNITYDSREYSVFGLNRDNIVKCTTRAVTWYDKSGKEKKVLPISANKPVIKSAGAYILVADLNGRDLYLFKGLNLIWSKKTTGSLINADVSEDGFVCAVQETKGYRAKIEVFDPQLGDPLLLTRTIAESFVLGSRVLPSGEELFINKVDASGVTADARLEFSEMFEQKPFADVKLRNAIFPMVHYMSDDSVLAAGDSSVVYLDKNKKVKWHKEYKDRRVYGAAASMDKYAVIAVDEGERAALGSEEILISVVRLKDGREAAGFTTKGNVLNMSVSGNTIGINNGREARFFNIKGSELGIYRAHADIAGLLLLNEKEAAIITKNKISIVDIK